MNIEAVVKEYIEARDAYEKATAKPNSYAQPRRLQYGDPIMRRWVEARKALSEAVKDVYAGESIS